jgi:hypothetical protein
MAFRRNDRKARARHGVSSTMRPRMLYATHVPTSFRAAFHDRNFLARLETLPKVRMENSEFSMAGATANQSRRMPTGSGSCFPHPTQCEKLVTRFTGPPTARSGRIRTPKFGASARMRPRGGNRRQPHQRRQRRPRQPPEIDAGRPWDRARARFSPRRYQERGVNQNAEVDAPKCARWQEWRN